MLGTMMIKPWVKLLLVKAGIRNQNFGSCFGSYTEKYEEYLRWFSQAIKLDGEVLEFGVASGGTTCLMAQALNEAKTPKTIHSFDSFTGFNPDEFDKSYGQMFSPCSFIHRYSRWSRSHSC